MNSQKPLVSIVCAAFNQKDYIAKCIEGFISQKTNFPIEIIIHDDASTDGTQDIIRQYANQYPKIIHPIFQEKNQYSQNISVWKTFIYPKVTGKYIAECEGDDYWTDPLKLQRQVDFLENHPDYSLSTENADILFTNTNITLPFSKEFVHDVSLEDLLIRRRFPTASVVYRSEFLPEFLNSKQPSFDTVMWAYLATKGKVHFNPIKSSVYRRGCGVTESNKIEWAYTSERFNNAINKFYKPGIKVRKARNATLLNDFKQGWRAAKATGDKKNARKLFFKMITLSPSLFIKDSLKRKLRYYLKEKVNPKIANLGIKFASASKLKPTGNTPPVVVSLTSYQARFDSLHLCIKSLLNQTLSADKVILYITKDIEISSLPKALQKLQSKGLEIRNICDDIKPHKKYFYAMQEFKDALIVTADDDVIYPKDWLKSLVDSYKQYPDCISARRVHKISRYMNGAAAPYNTWTLEDRSSTEPSLDLMAIGVGGVLYPPGIFDTNSRYFNIEAITEHCLNADDVWLKFMEIEKGVKVRWVPCKLCHPYPISNEKLDKSALFSENLHENRNDGFIKKCEEFFGIKL